MITTGIDEKTLRGIVADVSKRQFDGNLIFNREPDQISCRRIAFTLRVKSSRGPGHRRSHTGRHLVAACFHAYSAVIERLLNGGVSRVSSTRNTFTPADLADWPEILVREGAKNQGSMMQPMAYGDACDCGDRPNFPRSRGRAVVTTMMQSDLRKCPHFIMVPNHYRTDGSCKCDSAAHRAMMIKEWDYRDASFARAATKP